MTREEEYALVQRIQSGDSDAFAVLMDLYQKQVYHLALRTVGNPEDAADMTQEAFLRAYRAIGSFRGDSKLSVWLYRLTQNVCIDFLRSRGRRPAVSLTVENEEDEVQELDVADDRFDPEVQYQRSCQTLRQRFEFEKGYSAGLLFKTPKEIGRMLTIIPERSR